MEEKELNQQQKSEKTEITGENYASLLDSVTNNYEAKIHTLEEEKMKITRELTNQRINGQFDKKEPSKKEYNIPQLRSELFAENSNLSNLEYCKKSLELRQAILETEGKDIFVGKGHNLTPTQSDYECAERVATVMQECIKDSEGNSDVFTSLLMSRTNDVKLPFRR